MKRGGSYADIFSHLYLLIGVMGWVPASVARMDETSCMHRTQCLLVCTSSLSVVLLVESCIFNDYLTALRSPNDGSLKRSLSLAEPWQYFIHLAFILTVPIPAVLILTVCYEASSCSRSFLVLVMWISVLLVSLMTLCVVALSVLCYSTHFYRSAKSIVISAKFKQLRNQVCLKYLKTEAGPSVFLHYFDQGRARAVLRSASTDMRVGPLEAAELEYLLKNRLRQDGSLGRAQNPITGSCTSQCVICELGSPDILIPPCSHTVHAVCYVKFSAGNCSPRCPSCDSDVRSGLIELVKGKAL